MISYDSKEKVLHLQMGYQSPTGIAVSQIAKIELDMLTPLEQQRLVAVSKLVLAFACGSNILRQTTRSSPSEDKKAAPSESMLEKATRIIRNTGRKSGSTSETDVVHSIAAE